MVAHLTQKTQTDAYFCPPDRAALCGHIAGYGQTAA